MNGETIKTARVIVSYRSSKSVNLLPGFLEWAMENDKYLRYKDPEPDKKAITDAIKAGGEVPFAELVTNITVTIK